MKIKNTATSVKRQIVNEIHKPARINFKRRRVIIKSLNDLFQGDLVEMIPYAKENKGYKYILIVINCFSKFVWALPLKTKSGSEVSRAMDQIFQQKHPNNFQTDMGLEFYNKDLKKVLKKYNINHYSSFSEKKASIVERVNRTLKNKMWKDFNFYGHYKWIDLLANVVNEYNHTKHRTTGMKPVDVKKKHEKILLETAYNQIKLIDHNQKFKVGDHVRISKVRGVFDKQYTPNWSTEIFQVKKIQLTNPSTYLLQDEQKKDIKGAFYNEQLLKVKYPDAYLVEKVVKKNKNKVLVKWLGFSDKFNSWIDANNIL